MAQLSYDELVALIKAHFRPEWDLGLPPEQVLYIRFSPESVGEVTSDVLELTNGLEMVVDRDSTGRVVAIEL